MRGHALTSSHWQLEPLDGQPRSPLVSCFLGGLAIGILIDAEPPSGGHAGRLGLRHRHCCGGPDAYARIPLACRLCLHLPCVSSACGAAGLP